METQPESVPDVPDDAPAVVRVDTSGSVETLTAGPDDHHDPEAVLDDVDRLLNEVEHALDRLDEGTYGKCASCGGPIPDEKLAGDPTARECDPCPTSGRRDRTADHHP